MNISNCSDTVLSERNNEPGKQEGESERQVLAKSIQCCSGNGRPQATKLSLWLAGTYLGVSFCNFFLKFKEKNTFLKFLEKQYDFWS